MNVFSQWQTYVASVGALIAIISGIDYVRSILSGHTKPLTVTWGGWSLVGILGILSSVEGGAGIGLIATAPFVAIVFICFLLSLNPKYGKPGGNTLDYLTGAVAAGVLMTQPFIKYSPDIGATVSVVADFIFLWPTLREAWLQPGLEAFRPWVMGAVAEILSVVALKNYSYASAAYPVYVLLGNLTVISALIFRSHRKPVKKKPAQLKTS